MKKWDSYAGGLMTLLGAAVRLGSMTDALGALTHIRPRAFPLMLGITLTFVGDGPRSINLNDEPTKGVAGVASRDGGLPPPFRSQTIPAD